MKKLYYNLICLYHSQRSFYFLLKSSKCNDLLTYRFLHSKYLTHKNKAFHYYNLLKK